MDNNNKIVNTGRFNYIDPNNFSSSGLDNNTSVPLEDLCISVELTTNTKRRTLLSTSKEGNKTSESSGENVRISFIEGSKINGENYLTTKYTDLRVIDNGGGNDEALGITNIDISFNSSYAPMITINFVDVRGAAIFEQGANSTYGVLFKLPYPIFRLKIKGYFGKPVTYCLHLIKVNSKFNAQTGNFEITANFVGYTYAMLTDVLLGYLKAIGYIDSSVAALRAKQVPTLDELITNIANIQGVVETIESTNQNSIDLSILGEMRIQLGSVESDVKELKVNLGDDKNLLPKDLFLLVKAAEAPETKTTQNSTINFNAPFQQVSVVAKGDDTKSIETYRSKVVTDIEAFNKKSANNQELKLDTLTFTNVVRYLGINRDMLVRRGVDIQTIIANANQIPVGSSEVNGIIDNLILRLGDNSTLSQTNVDVYDFKKPLTAIEEMGKKIDSNEKKAAAGAAEALKGQVKTKLNFDPTIKGFVNVITAHIEVFLGLLYDVSAQFNSPARLAQLSKFKDSKSLDITKGHDISPWPEYNEEDVEKYLGKRGVLTNPLDVPEIKLVEDIYQGILASAANQKKVDEILDAEATVGWYGVNPLDNYLFNSDMQFPYKRLPTSFNEKNIANEVLIRAVTFMGYSNRFLLAEEIKSMATVEAQRLVKDLGVTFEGVQNPLSAFKMLLINDNTKILNSSVLINGEAHPILANNNGTYEYIYTWKSNQTPQDLIRKYIPIEKGFNEPFPITNPTVAGNFLSNYNGNGSGKIVDGATYVKIISDEDYAKAKSTVASTLTQPTNKLLINNLNKEIKTTADVENVGFNPFGVTHGIQEFRDFDWGESTFSELEGKFVFYGDKNEGTNGFSSPRAENQTTLYDLDETGGRLTSLQVRNLPVSSKNITNLGSNKLLIANNKKNESVISYPLNNLYLKNSNTDSSDMMLSIFGSRFYYEQTKQVRALLFLHSLPWKGLTNVDVYEVESPTVDLFGQLTKYFNGPLASREIINLFKIRAGAIQVPKLWPVFIGAMIWRNESVGVDPIKFFNGNTHFLPRFDSDVTYPKKDEYLTIKRDANFRDKKSYGALSLINNGSNGQYMSLDILKTLPDQVKNAFVSQFLNFVDGTAGVKSEWDMLSDLLEVMSSNKTGTDFVNLYTSSFADKVTVNEPDVNNITRIKIPKSTLTSNYKNVDQHVVFSLAINNDIVSIKNNIYLVLKDGSAAMNLIKNYLVDNTSWIINTSPHIWYQSTRTNDTDKRFEKILVSSENLKLYFDTFRTELDTLLSAKNQEITVKEVFGSSDNDAIKLNIYRTLKAIYDKWIGGCDSKDEILFQRGERLIGDEKRAKALNRETSLIDSFRFVDRGFQNIGEKFYVNPNIINDIIRGNNNQSSYSILGEILSKNNFDFIALPAYVDYNNVEEVKSIFKPYPYYTEPATTGPSFVCVYVGQGSTKLDFNDSKNDAYAHPNDSFDFPNVPKDFSGTPDPVNEDLGVAFRVDFASQNQSIFKDVVLDQSEFTETSESLKIMDELGSANSTNDKKYIGQNLFNVWSVRSYKAEIEMMGDAMVQPMMYFQLNNIPMFHGAYLITSVKHNIKPNYMTTRFTGNRIRQNLTPLIDSATMYNVLLSGLKLGNAKGTLSDTINDVSTRSLPVAGTISQYYGYVTREISQNSGLAFQTKELGGKKYAIKEVGDFMELLATKWYTYAVNKKFTDKLYINNFSRYRGSDDREGHGENTKHRYGLAVDFRPMANNKNVGKVYVGAANYDSNANKEFIEFAIKLIKTDGNGLQFDNIILNDRNIVNNIPDKNRNNGKIVITAAGHNDHIHMEFYIPDRITKRVQEGYLSEENIVTARVTQITTPFNKFDTLKVTPPPAEDIAFYGAILKGIGAPVSDINLKTMYAWRQAEKQKAAHNPISTSLSYPNASIYNCHKVRNYLSESDGVTATVKTLLHPTRYVNIVSALRESRDISGNITELNTWGTGSLLREVLEGGRVSPQAIARNTTQIKKC